MVNKFVAIYVFIDNLFKALDDPIIFRTKVTDQFIVTTKVGNKIKLYKDGQK